MADFGDPRLPARFWSKCVKARSGCWLWNAAKVHDGYGRFGVGLKTRRAHRVAYEALVGPIDDEHQLDHLCRQRACCNPTHLEPVTCRENLLRGDTVNARNAAAERCQQGHPFTPENTYVRRNGRRTCRTCMKAYQAKFRRSRREGRRTPAG